MIWSYIKTYPIEFVINLLTIFFVFESGVFLMRWYYAEKRSRDYIFMKVILPRDDSKLDQEKKTEKDFKEKVAIM